MKNRSGAVFLQLGEFGDVGFALIAEAVLLQREVGEIAAIGPEDFGGFGFAFFRLRTVLTAFQKVEYYIATLRVLSQQIAREDVAVRAAQK